MGEVLCRGCDAEGGASASVNPGPSRRTASVVQHQESVLTGAEAAGACGKPCLREQDGPVHGRSRRGSTGAESAGCTAESPSNSRLESDVRGNRFRFEVTP
jgi:hypothetical protein